MKFNQVRTALGRTIRQKKFARAVDVSDRTVRNWRSRTCARDFPKLGRPAHDERAHRIAFWKVGREYLRQGRCGAEGIAAGIGGALPERVPLRLIRLHVKRFKACVSPHKRRRILPRRVRVDVLAKNALWVQDSTQVGRDESGEKIESQIIKDRGPLLTVGVQTGGPTHSQDVLKLLSRLKHARGLPLVLGSDNGSCYVSDDVEAYLRREKVIHLRSLPRTPEHNGSAEIGNGEIKRCAGIDKSATTNCAAAHASVVGAALTLNKNRVRLSKGLKTGAQLDETLSVGYHQIERDRFYRACSKRMVEAQQRVSGKREQRMAEREAIYSTLETFGLVKRYRGGSRDPAKAEIFS